MHADKLPLLIVLGLVGYTARPQSPAGTGAENNNSAAIRLKEQKPRSKDKARPSRDPFEIRAVSVAAGAPSPEPSAKQEAHVQEGAEDLALTATMLAGAFRAAVINDRVYAEGDEVAAPEPTRLVRVEAGGATVARAGGEILLRLRESKP